MLDNFRVRIEAGSDRDSRNDLQTSPGSTEPGRVHAGVLRERLEPKSQHIVGEVVGGVGVNEYDSASPNQGHVLHAVHEMRGQRRAGQQKNRCKDEIQSMMGNLIKSYQ